MGSLLSLFVLFHVYLLLLLAGCVMGSGCYLLLLLGCEWCLFVLLLFFDCLNVCVCSLSIVRLFDRIGTLIDCHLFFFAFVNGFLCLSLCEGN